MLTLEELLAQIIEKKKALDELRDQSPEMAAALQTAEEYHLLMNHLRERCTPPAISYSYAAPSYADQQTVMLRFGNTATRSRSMPTIYPVK